MKSILIILTTVLILSGTAQCSFAQRTASAKVDGVNYKAILYGDQSLSIKDSTKTVLHVKRADLYLTFEPFAALAFKDVNGDGYPDLLISYHSNVSGKQDLILYDKHSHKFEQIVNFPEYPMSEEIPGTNFFYSYHTGGCSDADWDSDLFKIENGKIIPVATMAGRGCENSKEKRGIFISKLNGRKQTAFKDYGADELAKYNSQTRFNFISAYWKANYAHL